MEKSTKTSHIRNPFASAIDEKQVWKELLKNSKPTSKEEFFEKVRQARQSRKDT